MSDWYRTFFDRAANDFWNAAVTAEQTAREVAFLVDALGLGADSRVLESASVREALVPSLASTTEHDFGGVRVHGRHRIDGDWLVSVVDTEHDGTSTRRTIRQLALPCDRIATLVEGAGFVVTARLGGTDGAAFTAAAPSLLLVAERAG